MSIQEALQAFKERKLVAIPTETVYGLAAPINDKKLVEKIFHLKKRPLFDPLIVHVADIKMAKRYAAHWPDSAQILADHFWPGPLTLVLEKKNQVDDMITAGLSTVGLRVPRHKLCQEFIASVGQGLAAPSANTFTKTSPTKTEHVKKYFASEDVYILEGGHCDVGIESTIVKVEEDKVTLLRPGMLSLHDIEEKTGLKVEPGKAQLEMVAPGSHHTHYKPTYPLIVLKHEVLDQKIAEFEERFGGKAQRVEYTTSPQLIARSLYNELHAPLQEGHAFKILDFSLCFEQYPHYEWEAIFNRLEKASAK